MDHLTSKKHTNHKQINVSHVHAKPHRKRHYALLLASLALGISVVAFLLAYINQAAIGQAVASQTIESVFGGRTSDKTIPISSSYGFTISYNAKQYYASAVDADTGTLYVGDELSSTRPYDVIRLTTRATGYDNDSNSIRVMYYPHDAATATPAETEQRYITDRQADKASLTKVNTAAKTVHGVNFQRTEWSRQVVAGKLTLHTTFVTYAANIQGHPFTTVVYRGTQSAALADTFIDGMSFSVATADVSVVPNARTTEKHSLAMRLLDTALGFQVANAASAPTYTASERLSATYGPAVVKVYNVYVADLMLDGKVVDRDYLSGSTGSGFIVSGDGYIATNGHVVVNDPKEQIIMLAFEAYSMGQKDLLGYLLNLTTLQSSDIAGKTSAETAKIMVQALYDIPDSHFAMNNVQANLLVGLGSEQVDVQELVTKTRNHQAYTEQSTIKKATLEASDFGGILLPLYTEEFKASDVALLKLTSGSDYPMVKLGVLADAAQGSNLNIMGYPGTGSSSNGIVSKTVTSATLTTGKVSAQKKDNGGRSIIETDTEIGHGNSGGPAFTDSGDVIGIATYTSDTGEAGDGVLNYIRDIADFTKIADKKFVNYKTVSETQKAWNKAIELFYQAHYKAAIPNFEKVQKLYPAHPQVAAMIASSQKHIANGENIDEFPVALVVIIAAIAVIGAGVAVVFILQHKKKHQAYVHGVTTGQIQPMAPGMSAQPVIVPSGVSTAPAAFGTPSWQTPQPVSQPGPQVMQPQQPVTAQPMPVATSTSAPAAPVQGPTPPQGPSGPSSTL